MRTALPLILAACAHQPATLAAGLGGSEVNEALRMAAPHWPNIPNVTQGAMPELSGSPPSKLISWHVWGESCGPVRLLPMPGRDAIVGRRWGLRLEGVPEGASVLVALSYNASPEPASLVQFGLAADCKLLIAPQYVRSPTLIHGLGFLRVQVPNEARFAGQHLFAQALVTGDRITTTNAVGAAVLPR